MFNRLPTVSLLLIFVLVADFGLAAQKNKNSKAKVPGQKKSAMQTLRSVWDSRVMTMVRDCGAQTGTLVRKMHRSVNNKRTSKFDDLLVFLRQSYKVYKNCRYLFYLKTQGDCYEYVKSAGKDIKKEANHLKELKNKGEYFDDVIENSDKVKQSIRERFDALREHCKIIYDQKKLPKYLRDEVKEEDFKFQEEDISESESMDDLFGTL